jgi:hypothetical protein
VSTETTDRLNAPSIRAYRSFTHNLDLSNVTESMHVRAPTKLETMGARSHDTNALAVLITEEGNRPHGFRFCLGGLDRFDVLVTDNVGIDERQNLSRLFWFDAGAMRKVEAKSVRSHVGTLLANVVSEDHSQSRVQ